MALICFCKKIFIATKPLQKLMNCKLMNSKLMNSKLLNSKKLQIAFLIIASLFSSTVSAKVFAERPEVKKFIATMVKKHDFNQKKLTSLFKHFEPSQEILQKIARPYEELTWTQYRKIFITQKRIQNGVAFWKKYATILKQAEQTYGVPSEIIVAILGVETFYGENTGKYPVLQALATLAFDYPKRSAFFLGELEQYLLLTREQHLPADKLTGSYAGAMGSPQFIASSYRNFAVDFVNAGKIDLINNIPNAIGSVANYFKIHGWHMQEPIIHKAQIKGSQFKALPTANKQNPKPTLSFATLKKHNILPITGNKLATATQFALIQLNSTPKPEYWLGRNNFYVITRYNHSVNYAMAVYELSQNIAKEYTKHTRSH